VDDLFAAKDKFLLSVPLSNKWLQHAIDDIYESIHGPEGYQKLDDEILYVQTRLYPWGDKPYRCYLHLYYNARKRADAIDRFNEELFEYKQALESEKQNSKHQWAYDAFFIIKTTPKRGRKVTFNMQAVNQYIKRYAGFQALLSNSIKDPVKALQIYRDKDVVEKCFDDLKNQLDMKRLRMHSSATTDGRLFVQFIALIYVSALRKEMRKSDLIKHYSVRELLQETETLTKIKYSGKYGHILTEMTKPQREILTALNIDMPGKT
jgi:transposase